MNNAYIENPIAYIDAIQEIKYPCRKCGRKAVIPAGVKRQICHWCGHWVYTDKKVEFREKFKEIRRKKERCGNS